MKLCWTELWQWRGSTGRGAYLTWGLLLLAIKYNLDRLLLQWGDGTRWEPWDYLLLQAWSPVGADLQQSFSTVLIMLAVALPFLAIGLVLTLRRLHDAGLPYWPAIFFVVPIAKLVLFAVLVIAPTDDTGKVAAAGTRPSKRRWTDRLVPHSRSGAAVVAVVVAALIATGGTFLSTQLVSAYGWALFVGVPFVMGFAASVIHGYRKPRRVGECIAVSLVALGFSGLAIMAVALEGVICLLMAAPIATVLAIAGSVLGYVVQAAHWRYQGPACLGGAIIALPFMAGIEHVAQPEAPLLEVRTVIVVDAPPENVWRHVVSFSELPEPTEWLFRAGIAYPIRAQIDGVGVGAVRHCVFSTGPFVEPIEVWDEARLLKFSVTENPAPMEEWTPYAAVHPPHLAGFLVSTGGQFQLAPMADGKTRLEGTTWYQHHLWPVKYWQWWSDFIIHRIHLRVLNHVKQLSEADAATHERPSIR